MAEGTVTLSTKEYMKLLNENKAMKETLEGKGVLLKNVGWNSDGETDSEFILVPEEKKNEFLAVAFKQTLDMLEKYINECRELRRDSMRDSEYVKAKDTEPPILIDPRKLHTHWWK